MQNISPNTEIAVVANAWFDGEIQHRAPATFLIGQGRILQIAKGDCSREFSSRGIATEQVAFLMPCLVDAHVHLFLDGAPTDGAVRSAHLKRPLAELTEAARGSARQARRCGVSLVRDAGDRHGINHAIRAEARGTADLAAVRSAGLGVKRPKRYGAFMASDAANDDAIRATVTDLARESDEIKLILTGIIDFEAGAVTDEPQFDLHAASLVVDTARACGRQTFAHCSGEQGLAIAAGAGVASIEHGFFMTREILAVMRDKQISWTPTFCPVHFQWAHPEAIGWSPNTVGNLRRILDRHAQHLQLADEMGVRLLLGTDAGSMGVEHGYAIYDEIDRFLEAGLSLEKTLAAASSAARRHFGASQPLLAEGVPFEVLLLEQSPFEHIDALRGPKRVWGPA